MSLSEIAKSIEKKSEFVVAYDFEIYDILETHNLFRNNRWVLFATIVLYLSAVYFGHKFMKNRQPYKLTRVLFFWNLGLGIFSGLCAARGLPEVLYHLSQPGGPHSAACIQFPHNYATSFWGLLMVLSKFVELGDTAFIVLRKQKLIPLHWFHHIAAVVLLWFGYEYYETAGRLFFINPFVHTFMYIYYAVKALKIRVPKKVSQALTSLQILQLTFAMYMAGFIAYNSLVLGRPCHFHAETVSLGAVIIAIVLALFVKFYKESYLGRRPNAKDA